jgi:predicted nucleotidyltransferase
VYKDNLDDEELDLVKLYEEGTITEEQYEEIMTEKGWIL